MQVLESASPNAKQRILIVDDHPLVRAGIAAMIQTEPDLEVCGEAATIQSALNLFRAMLADLIIVDLSLTDGSGLDLIKRLKAHNNAVRVLVCSMHEESLFAERAIQAGAMGYINKQQATSHVIEAVRRVLAGKIYLSDAMIQRALTSFSRQAAPNMVTRIESLTNRELEVFGLIGRGFSLGQIAETLHLSIKTVEAHRNKIKKKLCLQSAGEVARQAFQWTLEQG